MDGTWFVERHDNTLASEHRAMEVLVSAALPAAQRRLRATVLRRLNGNRAAADDVLQDFAVKALGKAATLRDATRVDAWLASVLRTVLADHGRRLARLRETAVDPDALADLLSAPEPEPEPCGRLAEFVGDLRRDQADLIRRVDLGGEPHDAVARSLGVLPNALHVRLHRARGALRATALARCPSCAARFFCAHAAP
jgi:DNA-directed RNA polymerase specialized sigma24 family protein